MASEVLKADLKSPLVLEATSDGKVEVLSNKLVPSTGILYNEWVNTPCNNSIGTGSEVSGRTVVNPIPRNGKWQMAMTRIRFKFTGTAPTVNLGLIGLRIANQELSTYSQTLFTQTSEALAGYVQNLLQSQKQAIYQRALLLDNATELPVIGVPAIDTPYCTYVPSMIPSFTRTRSNWDTDILEPLLLRTTISSKQVLGLLNTTVIQSSVDDGTFCNVFTQSVDYDEEYRNKLIEANFGNTGQNMPFFSYNFEQQVGLLGSTTTAITSSKVRYTSTTPAAINYLFVRPVALASGAPSYLHTHKIDLTINNRSYVQDIPSLVMSYKSDMTGGGGANFLVGAATNASTVTADPNKVQSFTWCDRPQDRNGFSGALAYGGINNPEFTFHFASVAGNAYEYVIVSLYYCELYMNGKSGVVFPSVSS